MFIFIITIHIIVSLFLIAVILLQAGRGGGLAEAFGSSEVERLFGTKSATILTRFTTTSAIIFISTCLILAVLSAHRSRSLIERIPEAPPQAQSQKVSEPQQAQPETKESSSTGEAQKEEQPIAESAPKAE